MNRIVILASGSGSNAENIINYFKKSPQIKVVCVLTNKRLAAVIDRCNRLKVPAFYFNKTAFLNSDMVLSFLKSQNPSLIVLAGFLWKIPKNLIVAFPNKIVNIHPALLPKYGGKGMYGNHVHETVKANKETETGITIHFVNENYDEGAVIHQASTKVSQSDTAEDIATKVHALEYEHFPKVIEKLLNNNG
ncbi:phosphoribosylglycinamide formyltransferase [Croceitalea rosinachiae]|uniref:Phosphoribosylglycinamide formyltransferase n=1 Tax=Croceitalea rosinachiae TaxID=3075596 RepID=A0ABU3A8D2_9FLAO|nr:phosphoribosylglycinamide formyltransferase [Croceitalea sp. F388]MDT0606443.1 phosphoribosylglycinamide formyltransferase [Croceitalea sp. F388]